MRQCISSHRFLTGAPSLDLGHGDVPGGPECTLPHHPSPCPWVGPRGQPCPYIPPAVLPPPPVSAPSNSATSSVPTTSTVSISETPSGDHLLQELHRLRREKEEEARRVEQLTLANSNLRDSQARLSQQLQEQSQVPSSLLPPSSISFTPTTVTSLLSLLSSQPAMGTGFS